MFMLTVQQKGKNGQAKMHFFSEMTEFRLGKSSWRNSVREENAPAIVRALVSCVRQVSASCSIQQASPRRRGGGGAAAAHSAVATNSFIELLA